MVNNKGKRAGQTKICSIRSIKEGEDPKKELDWHYDGLKRIAGSIGDPKSIKEIYKSQQNEIVNEDIKILLSNKSKYNTNQTMHSNSSIMWNSRARLSQL